MSLLKAVWSFWAKPVRARCRRAWLSDRHHLCAWILSVETARKHYPHTCLYTDDAGARLLVDGLGLEFEHVSTALNALEEHDPAWWAIGKLYTYRLQTDPFVHLDNDVFLWKPLSQSVESAPVFAQNPEYFIVGASYYQPQEFERVLRHLTDGWIPEEWTWYRSAGRPQRAECCGVFGGNRVDFVNHFADLAIRLIEHPANQRGWELLEEKIAHNILFEQYLLSACIEYHRDRPDSPYRDIDVQYVFRSSYDAFNPEDATKAGFTHLIAGAKRNATIAARLEKRVQQDYPEHYERCIKCLFSLQQWPFSSFA
jgi:hypothetical protein